MERLTQHGMDLVETAGALVACAILQLAAQFVSVGGLFVSSLGRVGNGHLTSNQKG